MKERPSFAEPENIITLAMDEPMGCMIIMLRVFSVVVAGGLLSVAAWWIVWRFIGWCFP